MKCTTCREELELLVGMDNVPDEIQRHLSQCPECHAFWNELNSITEPLNIEKEFQLSEFEAALIERNVLAKIHTKKVTKITPIWTRLRYVGVAAAFIIVAGVSIISYRVQMANNENTIKDSVTLAQVTTNDSNTVSSSEQIITNDDLSTIETDISLDNISNTEGMLDSLSTEELQYLEKNFDVKGLL